MKPNNLTEFERGLLESIRQAKNGEFAIVHTVEMIAARSKGRPIGSTKTNVKQATTIRLSPQALESWRSTGKGWQTRAAQLLENNAPRLSV